MTSLVYLNEANIEKPLICLFTCKDVSPGQELCFSYFGLDDSDSEDEDEEDEVSAFVPQLNVSQLSTSH